MSPRGNQRRSETRIPGSVSVGSVFGVPVRLHFTFVLLLIFLLVAGLGGRQTVLLDVVFILALFASVLLHELSHALVARRCGVRTLEIVMFPIGGVARLERTPRPRQELWIASAGPALNIFVAVLLIVVAYLTHGIRDARLEMLLEPTKSNLLERIAMGNLILGIFNLLPAFPMDGGRILRSLLALFTTEEAATRVASRAGRLLAVMMGLYGLLSKNYMLVFVAFFVYLGAAQEGEAATGRTLTHGVPVRSAMITDFRTLAHSNSVREAAELLLSTTQQDFPVMHGDQVVGLLDRNSLVRALALQDGDAYVAGCMDRDFVRISPGMDLAEALPVMANAGPCALVMDGDRLLGMLTRENLSEFVLLRRFGIVPGSRGNS